MVRLEKIEGDFLNIAREAGLNLSENDELVFPLTLETAEKIYDLLLEPQYANKSLGLIFSNLESSHKSLYREKLHTRCINSLNRHGIENLDSLRGYTVKDIHDFRNLGANSLFEVLINFILGLSVMSQGVSQVLYENDQDVTINKNNSHENSLFKEENELQKIPKCVVTFLNEISQDFTIKELQIINSRADFTQKISHSDIGVDWGITRQRVHQIEKTTRMRLSNDSNLIDIVGLTVPQNSFIGISELLSKFPFLNLGLAIHPIGVSIINLMIFSRLVSIHDDWIVQNADTTVIDLLKQLRNENRYSIQEFSSSISATPQILNYLGVQLARNEEESFNHISLTNLSSKSQLRPINAAEKWLTDFLGSN